MKWRSWGGSSTIRIPRSAGARDFQGEPVAFLIAQRAIGALGGGEEVIAQRRVAGVVAAAEQARLFQLGEAPLVGRPITVYAGSTDVARTYRELAREVIDLG